MPPYDCRGSLFRMASFRLATLGTLFTTIGAIIVYGLIYLATFHAARSTFEPIIGGELTDLMADAAQDKLSLPAEIRQTISQSPHTFYALEDAKGNFLAGNMAMPASPLGWQELTRWANPTLAPPLLQVDGIGTRLADGDTLFLGEDASAFAGLNTHIAYLFAAVFGFTVVLGLLASMLIAFYSLRRVQAISDASRQILGGDLSRRIKLFGIDDELDFLTTDLNKMLAAIEMLVENAGQVTSDIAHDLRSPLARLRDHLEMSRDHAIAVAGSAPSVAYSLTVGLNQLDHIIGIFAAVLRIAEIEAGAVRGDFAVTDMSELCNGLVESYESVAEDRGQSLTGNVEDGISMVGDRALLTQMLVNLIENSLRHCATGVSMQLAASVTNHMLTIEMADHGTGIAESERERVFRRFVRLDRARQTPGNGLGLAMVRAVVSLHDGTVSLHDNDPGLIVRLRFPAAQR